MLIVDETGFIKKGDKSAGVQRQYSGTAGRVENCQLGVFLAYASPLGRALIDAELYLPKSWTDDRIRCAQAGIPDAVPFATKPMLARTLLARALDAGMPVSWVTADEAYGMDCKFRRFLEERRLSYVVAVPKSQTVAFGPRGDIRADTLAAQAPAEAWKRRSCGDGAKGPRLYDWALASVHFETEPGYRRWLLVRRSLTPNAKGELELAYYCVTAPPAPPPTTSSASPGHAGRSRTASRALRTRPAWTTTRSAATTPGIGTSPLPCWPTPTSRSPPLTAQKPKRPGRPHTRRNPPSPGTPDEDHPPDHPRPRLVPSPPPPPDSRP
ncbi:hypothetical protein FHU36_006472 [Nonomuraea muscovyensis]|uniref:Transposase IS701-like DDE domain-containing protein n=1 Tax=Nonomuraea muscovyensis TaxID=1124761 RepID=A0A7X0C7E6_9ACTN|nr:hypothetical protein [Nonomuraea muscovyensis]